MGLQPPKANPETTVFPRLMKRGEFWFQLDWDHKTGLLRWVSMYGRRRVRRTRTVWMRKSGDPFWSSIR